MKFHHFGFVVRDIEESIHFYKTHFGFKAECRFVFMDEEIVFLTSENLRLELISGNPDEGLNAHLCFEVNNLDEVMFQFSDLHILEGPYYLDNGWATTFFEVPDRQTVELLQITNQKNKVRKL